jgi:ABC-2 type transport system ATP-binding protein
VIEVDKLTRRYGSYTAVDNISFKVGKGEIVGFLGPNGAGKTTTMRVLTCYQTASAGTARVAGFDVFEASMEVRRRIGYLPEHPPLYRDMRVRGYLDFVARIKGVASSVRKGRVDDVMARCGIEDRAGQLIGQLSKGYQQRVGLAQALVHEPDVIILDEPTIGLDPNQIREVRDLIRALGGEHTVILSTHILPEVEMTCDRVIIINQGRIVAIDSTERLLAGDASNVRYEVTVDGDEDRAVQAIKEIEGVMQVTPVAERKGALLVDAHRQEGIQAALASRLVERGLGLLELRRVEASLEDIFHQLTTNDEGDR